MTGHGAAVHFLRGLIGSEWWLSAERELGLLSKHAGAEVVGSEVSEDRQNWKDWLQITHEAVPWGTLKNNWGNNERNPPKGRSTNN